MVRWQSRGALCKFTTKKELFLAIFWPYSHTLKKAILIGEKGLANKKKCNYEERTEKISPFEVF
jgi:hypothetical protein